MEQTRKYFGSIVRETAFSSLNDVRIYLRQMFKETEWRAWVCFNLSIFSINETICE